MKRKYVKRVVSICLLLPLLTVSVFFQSVPVSAATDISINWNDLRQEIDGFGVSQAYWSFAIADLQEPVRSQVMDLLFTQDNGVGMSILRGEIFPEYHPSLGVYDFAAPKPDQVWVMQQAKARGVDKIIATTWSPPAWMKTNNQTTYGGYLKGEYYDEYALFLAKFVKQFKLLHDIDIYAVSMSNEPNSGTFLSWNSCEWDSTGIRNLLADHIKPTFLSEGIAGTKVIAAEPSWWSEDLMKDALNDPASCERLDIVGSHSYPIPVLNIPLSIVPFSTAVSKGKKVWMTEVSKPDAYDPSMTSGLKWAKNIHDFMIKAQVNAWMYWTGAIPELNDEGLICTDLQNNTYVATKRLYTMGQFSKFIRPGYVRIGATDNPVSGVYVSAYKDSNTGKFSIVAINDNSYTCDVNIVPNGFTAGKIVPYTTNDSLDIEKGSNVPLNNGKYNTLLPPKSVTTFVGENGLSLDPVPQIFLDNLDDWSNTFSHTSGLVLDSTNPKYFEWDYSRAKRTNSTTENIIYNVPNIKNFTATFYQYKSWDGIAFYASSDNQTWTKIEHVCTEGVHTGGSWHRKIYMPLSLIPQGTNYLKVEIGGSGTWEKQLAKIEIKY